MNDQKNPQKNQWKRIFTRNFWKNLKQRAKSWYQSHPKWGAFLLFLLLFNLGSFTYFTERVPFAIFFPSCNKEIQLTPIYIYLPDNDLLQMVKEKRYIYPYTADWEKAEAIFYEVAKPAYSIKTRRSVPEGAELRRVWTKKNIIYIDFREKITKLKLDHKDQEKFLFYGLTRSLIENMPKYEGVFFLVEGKPIDTIWGSVDLTGALTYKE